MPLTVVGQTERYCHAVDFKLCNCPRQAGKRKQDEELSFMLYNRVNRVSVLVFHWRRNSSAQPTVYRATKDNKKTHDE